MSYLSISLLLFSLLPGYPGWSIG